MEQLKQLCSRLLGKKSVAIILGLLGLCCPSSLWAEKLDTTFVLDMVIDSTPCYYTEYNAKGQITRYGIHSNSSSDFSHVNIGYVTDMTGKRVDTIYYVRDRVTKQWSVKEDFINPYDPYETASFYSSGMLKSIDFDLDRNHLRNTKISEDGALVGKSREEYVRGTEYSYRKYSEQYDQYGNITLYEYSSGGGHQGGSAWSYGGTHEKNVYTNEYDGVGNLIATTLIAKNIEDGGDEGRFTANPEVGWERQVDSTITISKEEHQYDSENRRIKTVRYDYVDEVFVVKDSTIYSYGHALHEGEACLLSVFVGDNPVDSFSPDKFHYDFPDVAYNNLGYITSFGSITEKTYDAQTSTLTLVVKGADAEQVKTYTFTLKKAESFMTALSPDSILSIDFSPEKYQYDELEKFYIYSFDSRYFSITSDDTLKNGEKYARIHFDVSEDAHATYSYDARNGIFTITVTGADAKLNPDNVHTYTFKTKKIEEAYISSLQFKKKDFEGFSPDIYDYEMPAYATLNETEGWNFNEKTYPEFLYTQKKYSRLTHTMTIYLFSLNEYEYSKDTLATYLFHYKPEIYSVEDNSNTYDFSNQLDGFSGNVYEYELGGKYYPGRLDYSTYSSYDSIIINESFDRKTNLLTVSASFKNDSIRVTNYYFHFPEGYEGLLLPSLHLTIGDRDGIAIDSTEFEVIGSYNSASCQFDVTNGKIVSEHFDDSTNVLTIVVLDEFSVSETEYHIHFRPTDGVDDFLGDQVNLYVTDKTICVDGATEPIYVYNLLGTLVGTGRGEEIRIPVAQAGVYVVKTGGKAAKVVVK